jgi:glyoxylase-like metal-dependent hydrolase (beta-lactamase superfamily II)
LAKGVRRIVAPNAGLMTGTGTNTYLLGTREIAVLDPGPDDAAHLQAILTASVAPIRWIIVGARLIGLPPPADGRQDETFGPDDVPRDGERLPLPEIALTAIHTPGHASNCVCYLAEDEHLLFTGDHVLEGVSPVILPPDGDMSAYMQSLDRLQHYDFERIAPGHGGVMEQGKRVVEALRRHRLAREDKVMRALRLRGAATLDELTPAVYDDVPAERHAWAKLTLEAHLIKLVRDGRLDRHDGVWRISDA